MSIDKQKSFDQPKKVLKTVQFGNGFISLVNDNHVDNNLMEPYGNGNPLYTAL